MALIFCFKEFGATAAFAQEQPEAILPAALMVDIVVRGKLMKFSWIGLGALGLLVLSIPDLLTERLHLDHSQLPTNALGFLGLHVERLMVFAFFWALLVLLWKAHRPVLNDIC